MLGESPLNHMIVFHDVSALLWIQSQLMMTCGRSGFNRVAIIQLVPTNPFASQAKVRDYKRTNAKSSRLLPDDCFLASFYCNSFHCNSSKLTCSNDAGHMHQVWCVTAALLLVSSPIGQCIVAGDRSIFPATVHHTDHTALC